jgi:transketolase
MINSEMVLTNDFERMGFRSMRDGFGEGLMSVARKRSDVVVVCADLKESTRVDGFAVEYPDRFVEVGVAEQNMLGVAAGLALSGKVAVAVSYGVFSPGRNWDQLRVSVCYSGTNVKIIGSHAGVSVGADGATHQALEDIAITRVLPGLVVVAPCDLIEAGKAIEKAIEWRGGVYIRLNRNKTGVITTKMTPFEIGKANVLTKGSQVTVVACGAMVVEALMAALELEGEISVEVIDMATIKPLDEETLLLSVGKTGRVVTVEEHQIIGGLGGAVAEVLGEKMPVPMIRMGMNDCFGESGESEELLHKYGLDKVAIKEVIRSIMKR